MRCCGAAHILPPVPTFSATALRSTLLLALLAAASLPAQTPALRALPSTRATTEVTLAYPRDAAPPNAVPQKIRVDYGQPHLRGRSLHTDSLVPFDSVWRTGANAPTTLTTDVPMTLGGTPLEKGTYTLMTLPTRRGWKLIIQPFTQGQSATVYSQAKDIARIELRARTAPEPLETFSIWLTPSTTAVPQSGELRMAWGTFVLSTDWALR